LAAATIKQCGLWDTFGQIKLTENMRLSRNALMSDHEREMQTQYAALLENIGIGAQHCSDANHTPYQFPALIVDETQDTQHYVLPNFRTFLSEEPAVVQKPRRGDPATRCTTCS